MKIVNRRKFVRTLSIVIFIVLGVLIFTQKTYSKGEIVYKENFVYAGDTLWSIAKDEANINKYFEGKDIREIVFELKDVNNLSNSNLNTGDKIIIPEYK